MERRHRSVFPILAAQLRFMGAVGIGACWIVRLAYLEGQVALGRQTASGYRFRADGSRDFRFRLFRSNRPLGMGQSQAHGVGLLSYSAFSVERHHWALGLSERAVICLLLFGSGFVSLLGGLSVGHPGFGLIERARLDRIGTALRPLPMDARFATYPTFNHPVLLQGRKVVAGYPGHLWTEGFDYGKTNDQLTALMNGAANWRDAAKALGVRYIFWGQDEKTNYQVKQPPMGSDGIPRRVR